MEEFFTRYEHTIAAVGAISTSAAVIISILIAWWSYQIQQPRIVGSLGHHVLIEQGSKAPRPEYLTLRVTNVGNVAVRITSSVLTWHLPFSRTALLAMPLDQSGDSGVAPRQYPFELKPHTSELILLQRFEKFAEQPLTLKWSKRARWFLKWFVFAKIHTDGNSRFKATICKKVREAL